MTTPRRRRAVVGALVALAGLTPAASEAGGPAGLSVRGRFSGSDAGVAAGTFGGAALLFGAAGAAERGPAWRDEAPVLIVDATPAEAQVYLDGRRLGAAGDLVALALPVSPGRHVVHVVAPGYRPSVQPFVASATFVRVRATLTPE
jgi:PEGA domain